MISKAWLFNLDAELELLRPKGYHPSQATLRACARYEPLARRLLDPGDIVLQERADPAPNSLRGYSAVAWCPTPSARRALHKAGATLSDAPSVDCLQRVNHRRFNAALGQTLDAAFFTDDVSRATAALRAPPTAGWMVKKAFGFAGRNVRRFRPDPTADELRWLNDAVRLGGVQLEPWQDVIAEYSLHGYIDAAFNTRLGVPCVLVDPSALSYSRVDQLEPSLVTRTRRLRPIEGQQLQDETERVANALIEAGYFGPFGVDAFAYTAGTQRRFNPRSEINARYTLAYAIGMGGNCLGPLE